MKLVVLLTNTVLLISAFSLTSCLKDNPASTASTASSVSGNSLFNNNPRTTEEIEPDEHFLSIWANYDKTQDESRVSLQVLPFDENGFPLEVIGDDYYAVNGTVVTPPSVLWFHHRITIPGSPAQTEVTYHTHDANHLFNFNALPVVSITSQHSTLSITQGDTLFFDTPPIQQGESVALYLKQTTPLDTVYVSFVPENNSDNFIVMDWQKLTNTPFVEGPAQITLSRQREDVFSHPTLAGVKLRQSSSDKLPVVLTW